MKSNDKPFLRPAPLAVIATIIPNGFGKGRVITLGAPASGFALVVTLMLMALLTVLVLGLLKLSVVTMRTASQSQVKAVAQANARMALMVAVGELQKYVGPDQRITAPSGILDSNPNTAAEDGVANPNLTGVWNARDASRESLDSYNTTPPDYSRDKPNFQSWLVSNAKPGDVEQLNFANDGKLANPVNLAESGSASPKAKAGRVPLKGGSFAWWVGDENRKARINRRDLLAREANPAIADLLAGFATPGAHGIKALADYDSFDSNSPASDKCITRGELALMAPAGTRPAELFHDVTPYAQSVLANVTTGSLREDLSLFLGRHGFGWGSTDVHRYNTCQELVAGSGKPERAGRRAWVRRGLR